jgi:hypothetical protein
MCQVFRPAIFFQFLLLGWNFFLDLNNTGPNILLSLIVTSMTPPKKPIPCLRVGFNCVHLNAKRGESLQTSRECHPHNAAEQRLKRFKGRMVELKRH